MARAMSEQAGGEHARVVQDQAVAGAEEFGEIAELPVLPRAARAIDDQHAGGGAVGEWRLRD